MERNQLRMLFKKELNGSLEITEWLKNEVLRCFDRAVETEKDKCPLCGGGCDCKGGV